MFESILAIAGGGLGGLLRFVPEVFKMVNAKGERAHELEMTKLQIEIDKGRSQQKLSEIAAQGDLAQIQGQATAYMEALKGQSQLTGVRWVDALNATVRPFLTYWWMALFTVYKMTLIVDAWMSSISIKDFALRLWTPDDITTLSMILSFWFVDRVFRHHK